MTQRFWVVAATISLAAACSQKEEPPSRAAETPKAAAPGATSRARP